MKGGTTEVLTQQLNIVDPTGNIKCTHEEEKEGHVPFLDTCIVRKHDGTIKHTLTISELRITHSTKKLESYSRGENKGPVAKLRGR